MRKWPLGSQNSMNSYKPKKEQKMKKKSSFRGKVGRDAQRQKKASSSYGYLSLPRDLNVFKEEPGSKMKIDIMPYEVTDPRHPDRNDEAGIAMPGDLWYKRPFKVHRNIGPNNELAICPTSVGKRCPICEYRAKRLKEGAEKAETDAMRPSLRNLYVVIPIENRKFEEKPHIWDISQYLFQNLLNEELEENPDCEIFPDLEEGLTLRVRFDSKTIGKSQPFADANRIDFEDREDAYDEKIMKSIPNLDEILIIPSFKELELKFFEMEMEEGAEPVVEADPDDDDPEPPVRKRKSAEPDPDDDDPEPPVRKRKREPEPEPDDDPEPPVRKRKKDPEQEEEAPPVRRKREPEPEPDDDPEPPVRKRKKDPEPDDEKQTCPHGFKFGKDCEKYDECDDCEIWNDCYDEQQKGK
jgi:hypothetical protein